MKGTPAFTIQRRLGILVGGAAVLFALSNVFYTYVVYSDVAFPFSHVFTRIYLLLIIGALMFVSAWKDSLILRLFQVLFFLIIGFMYTVINESGDLGGILFFVYAILLAFQYKYLRTHFYLKIVVFLAVIALALSLSIYLKPGGEVAFGIVTLIITLVFFYMINLLFSEEIRTYKASAEEIRKEYDSNRVFIKTGKNLAGIIHNIKSRMTSVFGFNELIREEALTSGNRDLIEYADLQKQAISLIMDQVQNLLFTSANSQDTEARPVSLNRMLEGTIELVRSYESVRHEVDISRNLISEDTVYMSPLYLAETIETILINALEAAPPGERARITIESGIKDGFLVLSISDAGRGVEELHGCRDLDCLTRNVFTPGKTTKETGSGIGMSSSVEMVRASGGKMFLSTGPGGTKIDLHLPRKTNGKTSG